MQTNNNQLNSVFIQQDLPALTVEILPVTTSTNLVAKEIAKTKPSQPVVIIANEQTGGYGRRQRAFASPKDTGIYLSILLKTNNTTLNPGLLTTMTALTLAKTVQQCLKVDPKIKWVNDLYLGEQKLAGILTESLTDEEQNINYVIVGVGLNYLTDPNDFPPELQAIVTSLRPAVLKQQISRNQFINAFLKQFFALYPNYQTANFMDEYRGFSNLIGHEVTLQLGKKQITGEVATIANNGFLILTNGQKFCAGEVIKIRKKQ